jgi:hypothetical protein
MMTISAASTGSNITKTLSLAGTRSYAVNIVVMFLLNKNLILYYFMLEKTGGLYFMHLPCKQNVTALPSKLN